MKVEVSTGELVDKVSILEIKLEKVKDRRKLENVRVEYDLLREAMESAGITVDSGDFREIKRINLRLWETENRIRQKEREGDFGQEFIELARSVYRENDRRSEIKRRINLRTGSRVMEEKEYLE